MFFQRVLNYLNPANIFGRSNSDPSLRFMHGVNRISLLMFLGCVIVMVIRALTR